jgi:hypothetical protein
MIVICTQCSKRFMTRPGDRSGLAACPHCNTSNACGAVAPKPKVKAVEPPPAAASKASPAYQAMQVRKTREHQRGGHSLERQALGMGAIGGVLLCVVAVVWFFIGLKAGIIFFYPPILFCIGIYGIITGLYDSATGKGRKRR